MNSRTNISNKVLSTFALCFFLIVVLISADYFLTGENVSAVDNPEFNTFYEELPSNYIGFIGKKSLDSVIDRNAERAAKNRILKYDAYIQSNEYSRELIVMKRIVEGDTTQIRPISFNIYPKDKSILDVDQKFIRYTINPITYRHGAFNYRVARQVLPNIEIHSIEPYSRYWKTTISYVNNGKLLPPKNDEANVVSKKLNVYNFLFEKQLKEREIDFLPAPLPIKSEGILSELEKYVQTNKSQLVEVPNDIQFWKKLTQEKTLIKLNYVNGDSIKIASTLNSYLKGELTFAFAFDEKKLAAYYALLNLYTNRTSNELYLQYNTQTKLLEPFFLQKELGTLNSYLHDLQIAESSFAKLYSDELINVANLEEIEDLIDDYRDEIREILFRSHRIDATKIFDKALFFHNKLIIQKALNPSTTTKIALIQYNEKQIEVEVENLTNFPIEIAELSFREKKFISVPAENSMVIMPSEKRNVVFDLPDSFNNLFVHKKKKTTGFIFEKNIFDLFVGYRLVGTSQTKYNSITPFTNFDNIAKEDDLFRSEIDLSVFEFLSINESNKTISFVLDTIVLNRPLVLPAGYTVNATEGLQIDIISGGKIISKSSLNFIGTKEKPIRIFSSDKKGEGIFVVGSNKASELKYVEFDHLTNQAHGLWDLTGAVVFYESPVNLDHVLISNNSCEDGLNIIRTHFTMKNTAFRNTQSDAFDGDFVQGTLTNCTFENLGNDAIDVSGSNLEMYDLKISNAGDKALSAGENSQMKAERIIIHQSEIAIAGKDLSIVEINNATISNSKLGFTAFQKKPEFGASSIDAKNVTMIEVEIAHLIENKSSLLLNGKQAETIDQVKEQMYGVEFGVDSKETRVKKVQ